MPLELTILLALTMVYASFPGIYLIGRLQAPGGWRWLVGNRDDELDVPQWTKRSQRAQANLLESLVPFAVLVIVGTLTRSLDQLSAAGALLFAGARAIHAVAYIAGWTNGIRTYSYWACLVALVMMFASILGSVL